MMDRSSAFAYLNDDRYYPPGKSNARPRAAGNCDASAVRCIHYARLN